MRMIRLLLACIAILTSSGCATFGQRHDSGGYSYYPIWPQSERAFWRRTMEDAGFPTKATASAGVNLAGARLAVAEIGARSPRPHMLEAFARYKTFASVQPCAGGTPFAYRPPQYGTTHPSDADVVAAARALASEYVHQVDAAMHEAVSAAKAAGCDYVVLMLWQSEGRYERSLLPFVDILILPLYFLPHEVAGGHATGMAWMIDTRSGQIVRIASARGDGSRVAAYTAMKRAVAIALEKAEAQLASRMAAQIAGPP